MFRENYGGFQGKVDNRDSYTNEFARSNNSDDRHFKGVDADRFGNDDRRDYGRNDGGRFGSSGNRRFNNDGVSRFGNDNRRDYGENDGGRFGSNGNSRAFNNGDGSRFGNDRGTNGGRFGSSGNNRSFHEDDDARFGNNGRRDYGGDEGGRFGSSGNNRAFNNGDGSRFGNDRGNNGGRFGSSGYNRSFHEDEGPRFGNNGRRDYGGNEGGRFARSGNNRAFNNGDGSRFGNDRGTNGGSNGGRFASSGNNRSFHEDEGARFGNNGGRDYGMNNGGRTREYGSKFGNEESYRGATRSVSGHGRNFRNDEGRGYGSTGPNHFNNHMGLDDSHYRPKDTLPRGWILEDRDEETLFDECVIGVEQLNMSDDQRPEILNVKNPVTLTSWQNSNLNEHILENLRRMKFMKPRPIQAAVIPLVLSGIDLIAQAETGSGKTGAYGLPIVHNVLSILQSEGSKPMHPICLILSPVRELATQIYEDLRRYSSGTKCKIGLAYGQMNIQANLNDLHKGCHILVGTPGRIFQYIDNGDIILRHLKIFVLDEADRHLDDLRDKNSHINYIISSEDFNETNKRRQTLLLSATFPEEVQNIAKKIMKCAPDQKDVACVLTSAGNKINSRISLEFIPYNEEEKLDDLFALLESIYKKNNSKKTLIFVKTKQQSDFIALKLHHKRLLAESVNGDRPQNIREKTVGKFKAGQLDILVGTDMCSRGLDIKGLDLVINFGMPNDMDTFIHRVGRTGRVKKGTAYSFLNPDDFLAKDVVDLLVCNDRPIPKYLSKLKRERGNFGGSKMMTTEESQFDSGEQGNRNSQFTDREENRFENERRGNVGFGRATFGDSKTPEERRFDNAPRENQEFGRTSFGGSQMITPEERRFDNAPRENQEFGRTSFGGSQMITSEERRFENEPRENEGFGRKTFGGSQMITSEENGFGRTTFSGLRGDSESQIDQSFGRNQLNSQGNSNVAQEKIDEDDDEW